MNEMVSNRRVALLDNSIQIDRRKMKNRRDDIDAFLAGFDNTITTGICLLEFKATLLAQCILLHDMMRLVGRYTLVRDRLGESKHPQAKLRLHILNNIVDVFSAPSSFDVTEDVDKRLADQARIQLRFAIPKLYTWFRYQSVTGVVHSEIACSRALEEPRFRRVAFDTNLPKCKRGINKFCKIESFIRDNAEKVIDVLDLAVIEEPNGQLAKTAKHFRSVIDDADKELSVNDCRGMGDCLIILEGMKQATHGISTNASEWEPLCEATGQLEFVRMEYPSEKRFKR